MIENIALAIFAFAVAALVVHWISGVYCTFIRRRHEDRLAKERLAKMQSHLRPQ